MSPASPPTAAATVLATRAWIASFAVDAGDRATSRPLPRAGGALPASTPATTSSASMTWRRDVISHPQDAVVRSRHRLAQHHRQREPEHVARVDRVDDAVVPQPRATEHCTRLLLVGG